MDKKEMMDFLKARGLFERGMQQLVEWQLMEMVENAEDMGVPTLEEVEEMEVVKAVEKKAKPKKKTAPKKKATKKSDKDGSE